MNAAAKRLPLLALFLLLLAAGTSNFLWLRADQRPSDWDQSRYMLMTRDISNRVMDRDPSLLAAAFVGNHHTHPHLVSTLAAAPYLLAGRRVDGAYFVNTLFLLGTALLVYLSAHKLTGAWPAWLAATAVLGLPLLAGFSRVFSLELGAAFFVTLAFFCLQQSRRFTATGWTVAWGIACAAALLTKWTTAVFLFGPALVEVVSCLAPSERRQLAHRGRRLLLAALISLPLVVPWYWTHRVSLQRFADLNEKSRWWTAGVGEAGGLSFYVNGFTGHAGWPLALVCGIGLVGCVAWRRPIAWRLVAWVVMPLLVFSFLIATRNVRHLLPAYPALALALACAVSGWTKRTAQAALVAVLGLGFIASHAQASWGFVREGQAIWAPTGLQSPPRALIAPEAKLPEREAWPFAAMLQRVTDDWQTRGVARRPRVTIVPGNFPFQHSGFVYLAAEHFPEVELVDVPLFAAPGNPAHRHLDPARILDSDYFLMRHGDLTGDRNEFYRYAHAVQRFVEADREGGGRLFLPLARFRLPGGVVAEALRLRRARNETLVLDSLDWLHEIDPDNPALTRYLAQKIDSPGALLLLAGERPLSSALAEIAAGRPTLRWPRRLLAAQFAAAGECRKASGLFEGLGPGTPYRVSPFEHSGDCWAQKGDAGRAQAAYRKAAVDRPEAVSVHRKLGDEAMASLLESMHRSNPNRDTTRFRLALGDHAARAGRLEEARLHYTAALANVPESREARARLDATEKKERAPEPAG